MASFVFEVRDAELVELRDQEIACRFAVPGAKVFGSAYEPELAGALARARRWPDRKRVERRDAAVP